MSDIIALSKEVLSQAVGEIVMSKFDVDATTGYDVIEAALDLITPEQLYDCVSRQAVLNLAEPYGTGEEPDGFSIKVEDVKNLPSILFDNQKWTSVIDSLPKIGQVVEITAYDGLDYSCLKKPFVLKGQITDIWSSSIILNGIESARLVGREKPENIKCCDIVVSDFNNGVTHRRLYFSAWKPVTETEPYKLNL